MDLDRQIDDIEWNKEDAAFAGGFVDYYVDFSRQHAQDSPQAHAWLDTEKDNMLGAAYQAYEAAQPEAVCTLAINLGPRASRFLDTLAYHEDAQRLNKLAIQAAALLHQPETEALFHLHLGLAYERRDQTGLAQAEYETARTLGRKLRDPEIEANSLINLGRLAQSQGEYRTAVNYLRDALRLARRGQDPACLITCLCNLGEAYQHQKQYAEAYTPLNEALTLARDARDPRQIGAVLHALGNLSYVQREWVPALARYEEAFALIEATADQLALLNLHNNMGMAYLQRKDRPQARRHLEAASALLQRFGNRHNLGVVKFNLAILHQEEGDLATAARLAREARDLFKGTPNETWAEQLLRQIEHAIRQRTFRHNWP